jgi:hypothetical protein
MKQVSPQSMKEVPSASFLLDKNGQQEGFEAVYLLRHLPVNKYPALVVSSWA